MGHSGDVSSLVMQVGVFAAKSMHLLQAITPINERLEELAR